VSRNILCVVEFDSYPDEVVSRATWLAKLHDLDLHLLVSDPSTDFLGNTYVYLLEDFRPIADSIKEYQEEALGRLSMFSKARIITRRPSGHRWPMQTGT
jgi:hypothetical protein